MKKLFVVCTCLSLILTAGGCSLGDMADKYILKEDSSVLAEPSPQARVYMDEFTGTISDFNGTQLTVSAGDVSHIFDVSQATLECRDGMIAGNEISIIYEGRLNDDTDDTSTLKVLKVVDEFHHETHLEEQVISGKLQGLTPNTITLQFEDNRTASYPVTGTLQYYPGGIRAGNTVYLHYKGQWGDESGTRNTGHLKVVSVSDMEPPVIPEPTPVPQDNPAPAAEKKFRADIQNISLNILRILPEGSQTPLDVDVSAVPCLFKGGAAPGSFVNVIYTGEFSGSSLDGISIQAITGDDPETLKKRNISFTVSGTIIGSTSNTITLQTDDGAMVTCNKENAPNSSTGGLLTGSRVKITFNPADSKTSNIYKCLRIEDA